MKCAVIRHVAFEDLGIFEPQLRQAGFAIEYYQAGVDDMGDGVWRDAALVAVMGGPISVYETDRYPWLTEEIAGIRRRLERKAPILGVCLGAQLMAAALGARVYPGKAKEIGWGGVELTAAGKASPLAALEGAPVLHWHGDTFDIPKGGALLAATAITPHQAFSIGAKALALQFHCEADGARIEPWLIGHTAELGAAGISIPDLRMKSARNAEKAAAAGRSVIGEWLRGAGLAG